VRGNWSEALPGTVVEINPPLIVCQRPIVLLARADASLGVSGLPRGKHRCCFGRCSSCVIASWRWYVFPDQPAYGRYCLLLLCFALFPLAAEDLGQRSTWSWRCSLVHPAVTARLRGREPAVERVGIGVLCRHCHRAEAALCPGLAGPRSIPMDPRIFRLNLNSVECCYPGGIRYNSDPGDAGVSCHGRRTGPLYLRYLQAPFYPACSCWPPARFPGSRRPPCRRGDATFVSHPLYGRCSRPRSSHASWRAWPAEGGLRYHFYPAFALAFVLLGLVAIDAPGIAPSLSRRLYGRVAGVLTATMRPRWCWPAIVDVARQSGRSAGSGPVGDLAGLCGRMPATAGSRAVLPHCRGLPAGQLCRRFSSRPAFRTCELFPASYWDALGPTAAGLPSRGSDAAPERYLWDAVMRTCFRRSRASSGTTSRRGTCPYGLRRLNYIRLFRKGSWRWRRSSVDISFSRPRRVRCLRAAS